MNLKAEQKTKMIRKAIKTPTGKIQAHNKRERGGGTKTEKQHAAWGVRWQKRNNGTEMQKSAKNNKQNDDEEKIPPKTTENNTTSLR